MNWWIDCADSLDDDSYSPIQRVHQLVPLAPPAESIATMPTEGRAENVSLVPADCTISGDGGMLVLQAAEPDNFPVPPGEGTSNVTIRLCAIVGAAMLFAGGLVWLPGMRQTANFATTQTGIDPFQMMVNAKKQSDETPRQVAKNIAKDVRSATEVESSAAENDFAATIGKPMSLPAPEVVSTAPMPMQVAKSVGKVEVRSATEVKSPAENDLAARTEKPTAAAPSLPAPEVAATGGTPKQTSQPAPAPVSSGPVSEAAPPSGAARQLDNTEIAMLVRRGKDFLKDGDLVSARLLLQRAVAVGSAEATFILGGAPFSPASEVAATGGTVKPTAGSALASVASGPVSGPALASAGATQLDNNEIAMLVTRGKGFLKDGDLASARLLFQRAAAAGNAEAAFILGTTFDPLFIHRMGVVGMESDVARAREWYKRAAELGSADASQQLATLQQRY